MYRIDSIAIFEGGRDDWLLEAHFLGFQGRRVFGTLTHIQRTGRTEIRMTKGRPTAAEVLQLPGLMFPFASTPSCYRREISSTLTTLGWGPDLTMAGALGGKADPEPYGPELRPRYT
jgi:hypothetical protein